MSNKIWISDRKDWTDDYYNNTKRVPCGKNEVIKIFRMEYKRYVGGIEKTFKNEFCEKHLDGLELEKKNHDITCLLIYNGVRSSCCECNIEYDD